MTREVARCTNCIKTKVFDQNDPDSLVKMAEFVIDHGCGFACVIVPPLPPVGVQGAMR